LFSIASFTSSVHIFIPVLPLYFASFMHHFTCYFTNSFYDCPILHQYLLLTLKTLNYEGTNGIKPLVTEFIT
jgi:hypothetical protein